MPMKIDINHPKNISPTPRNLSNPLNKLNTTEMIPTRPEKNPKHFRKHLHPSKKIKPLPEKSHSPWKNSPSPKIA